MVNEANSNLAGKRLVIFGCGYIGGAVALRAVAAGMRVTALTRNAEKAARLRLDGIEVVEADLADQAWHAAISGGADFVLNSVSSGGGGVVGYRRSYHDGMASILTWARRAPVGTIVYTSSTSVYAQGDGAVVTEEAAASGRSETAEILVETENLLRGSSGASRSFCQRWFIFRLAGIYGPGRHSLLDQLRAGADHLAGMGEHRLNLIYRDDAAAAILAAFGAPASVPDEVMNLADDAPAPKAEIVRWLAERLRVPPPTLDGAGVSARRGPVPNRMISNAKAKAVLGWRPEATDFRAGYEKILSL